jgi:hypothetical protein
MSWLLFLDESGHDHRTMPMEVRGGVALHAGRLWPFIQSWQQLEKRCFGTLLAEFGKEAKGYKLLDRDRMKWALQAEPQDDEARQRHATRFLVAGQNGERPSRAEFTAYGQACQKMARGSFDLLQAQGARLFATAIPRGVRPPASHANADFLRRDHVYLFERFYYFLAEQRDHGLLIMDETEKTDDRRFIARMERYFSRTEEGRRRSSWIVPTPLFVSSDMTYAVQAADICLYALNWGFRPTTWNIAERRAEISEVYGPLIERLQWKGNGHRGDATYPSRGIALIADPYRDNRE